jgi:G3E family GTPase
LDILATAAGYFIWKGVDVKMTKIDIVSGFLGAGKTTLIKKLLKETLAGTKVVLIENEFGQIGVDSGFLKESGIEIKEMNSGCICCSLVGDFGASLKEVLETYAPERILIEPSGVGKLSDVMRAVENVKSDGEAHLNSAVAVVDAAKCKMYMKNFGEFFINQIEYAGTIILSRTGSMKQEKIEETVALIRQHNEKATVITTPWEKLDGAKILETIEGASDLEAELMAEVLAHREEEHHHHHDEDGHEHHHHHHDEDGHEHHHHGGEGHDHDETCGCGCHDHDHHDHHGHHHADDVFTSWGLETASVYEKSQIEDILDELDREKEYGVVLRAKGMVPAVDGSWIHFDYVPGEEEVRTGAADVTGKICVIGSDLNEDALRKLFASV